MLAVLSRSFLPDLLFIFLTLSFGCGDTVEAEQEETDVEKKHLDHLQLVRVDMQRA